jgi:hypothetical protein
MEEAMVLLLIVVEVLLEDASWVELTEAIDNELVVLLAVPVVLETLVKIHRSAASRYEQCRICSSCR